MTDESPIHTVHKRVCQTFLRHWKAHNNVYRCALPSTLLTSEHWSANELGFGSVAGVTRPLLLNGVLLSGSYLGPR
ncbi:hypothetical protein EIC84_20715 [Comamonas sp. A23]|nr:hypothetical protein EIC84_20715 [Comamonas sp. A23]